jgi:iron(III) transport system ATP-binding protein
VAVLDQGVIQQVGTPVELYDTPANRFIAHFVGTINLLQGTLESAGAGKVFHSETLGSLAIASATAPAGPAEIAIRPHAMQLAAPGKLLDAGRTWIDGTVAEREFLGEFVRYSVKVGTADLVVDQPHYMGDPGFAPGATVRVGFNPAQVKILIAEAG